MLCDIEAFKSKQESYYGFNRITMTNAAVILAKQHKYHFVRSANGGVLISIPSDYFTSLSNKIYVFDALSLEVREYELPKSGFLNYVPRVYPLHNLVVPDSMWKIIDCLERFPDADFRPIFDTYWVMFPGTEEEKYDMYLLKQGIVCPILLGERDGKCFFISYWV
jgi:hypothetical protein